MYNYPLYYLRVASYKNTGNNHPKETRMYLDQAKELLQSKINLFEANGNQVEQLKENSYLVKHPNSNDPIVISILFDLETFKTNYGNFFYRINRSNDKMSEFSDILFKDNFVADLSVLQHRGKFIDTKILVTNSVNPLTIEDEFDDLPLTTYLQLGDILFKSITENCLIAGNLKNNKSLKIFLLSDCYYQPKQLVDICKEAYLQPNVILSTKLDRYLITTEDDDYPSLLKAYGSVLGNVKKIDYVNLQYAHIEYCDLFA